MNVDKDISQICFSETMNYGIHINDLITEIFQ